MLLAAWTPPLSRSASLGRDPSGPHTGLWGSQQQTSGALKSELSPSCHPNSFHFTPLVSGGRVSGNRLWNPRHCLESWWRGECSWGAAVRPVSSGPSLQTSLEPLPHLAQKKADSEGREGDPFQTLCASLEEIQVQSAALWPCL